MVEKQPLEASVRCHKKRDMVWADSGCREFEPWCRVFVYVHGRRNCVTPKISPYSRDPPHTVVLLQG